MFSKKINENLSKYKYIYRIYRVEDDFHIEYYPIIYSNSEYIYYKSTRSSPLNYVKINELWQGNDKLFENIDKAIEHINNEKEKWNYWNYPSIYFISEKIKDYDLSKIKINLKKESNKNKIKQIENRVKIAKKEYEKTLKELEDIKNVLSY